MHAPALKTAPPLRASADGQQQALYSQLQQQQMQRKIDKTQEQCRKKLTEVHNGYLTVGQAGRRAGQAAADLC